MSGMKEPGKERKHMARKCLDLTSRRTQQEDLAVSGVGSADGNRDDNRNDNGNGEKENVMTQAAPTTKKAPLQSAREVPSFQVELSPMEDIYRAAGIMILRKGYTIKQA